MDDPFFGAPFIDEDVWEDDGVRHRYVHGGFAGTDTRFAFYFPEPRHYTGRFLQFLEGGAGGHEGRDAHAEGGLTGLLEMATAFGAYFVECNTGHIGMSPGPEDQTIVNYRANAQSARYARRLAEEMYGSAPHHGYVFGGSGGGMRSLFAMDNVTDVWDGAVPFVCAGIPSPTIKLSRPRGRMVNPGGTLALLSPKSRALVFDAVEPGGGDPFEGLDEVEREALDALFKSGFPRRGLFQYAEQSIEALFVPLWIMMPLAGDPGYIEDFWTVPGHAGADGELAGKLVDTKATVSGILTVPELIAAGITDHPMAATFGGAAASMELVCRGLESGDGWPDDSLYARLVIRSGKAAGKELTCYGAFGDVLVVGGIGAHHIIDLAPSDEVAIDNRQFLAAAHYYRYAQQRETAAAGGSIGGFLSTGMSGKFHGKMIVFNATLDGQASPAGGVMLDELVKHVNGDAAQGKFRLWWVDNACHTGRPSVPPGGPPPAPETRAVMYGGVMQEALRSVIEWVEEGIDPAPSTVYRFEGGQLEFPATAAERQGVQPVAAATANGGSRAEVKTGTPVAFTVVAETPLRGGKIIEVAWDFDGSGQFAFKHSGVDGSSSSLKLSTTHTFDTAGTYFPAVRAVSERDGRLNAKLGRMENLDRVRVVVT